MLPWLLSFYFFLGLLLSKLQNFPFFFSSKIEFFTYGATISMPQISMCGSQQLQHEPFFCLTLSYYSECRCQVICKIECDLIPNFKKHVPRRLLKTAVWQVRIVAYCSLSITYATSRWKKRFSTVIVMLQLPSSNVYFSFVAAIISDLTKQLQTNIKGHHLIVHVCLQEPYSLFM